MDRLAMLKNLVAMAAADGSLTEREVNFLVSGCGLWNLDEVHLTDAIQAAVDNRDNLEIQLPSSKEACAELVRELVRMMAADGELAEAEKHLFATAAARMNLSGEEVDAIIDAELGE